MSEEIILNIAFEFLEKNRKYTKEFDFIHDQQLQELNSNLTDLSTFYCYKIFNNNPNIIIELNQNYYLHPSHYFVDDDLVLSLRLINNQQIVYESHTQLIKFDKSKVELYTHISKILISFVPHNIMFYFGNNKDIEKFIGSLQSINDIIINEIEDYFSTTDWEVVFNIWDIRRLIPYNISFVTYPQYIILSHIDFDKDKNEEFVINEKKKLVGKVSSIISSIINKSYLSKKYQTVCFLNPTYTISRQEERIISKDNDELWISDSCDLKLEIKLEAFNIDEYFRKWGFLLTFYKRLCRDGNLREKEFFEFEKIIGIPIMQMDKKQRCEEILYHIYNLSIADFDQSEENQVENFAESKLF